MKRPVPVSALDTAQQKAAEQYREARQELRRLRHEHADVLRTVANVEGTVREARAAIEEYDGAIRSLGYTPLTDEGNETSHGGRTGYEAIRANRIDNGVKL